MLKDHIWLPSRGVLGFDEGAAIGPPADFCFARCDNDSNGSLSLSTSYKLARLTFR